MTSVVDVWRAADPDALLVAGPAAHLGRAVRTVERTRTAPPHLPQVHDGSLLIVDGGVIGGFEELLAGLAGAQLSPVAVMVAGSTPWHAESLDAPMPLITSSQPSIVLPDAATAYLADEAGWLARLSTELRLLCAESTLGSPEVATPAGLIAARARRGVAVIADGELRSLHPRPAGRALAARFAAVHARGLTGQHARTSRRTSDGLWLMERQVRPGASVWLFDDLPFAAADEVAAEAAATTLRALLRRPAAVTASGPQQGSPRRPPLPGDPLVATMLVVARHNGRVAPAARELGVHRNTVLDRLRRGRAEHGLDPRRPEDALRLISELDHRV